MSDAVEDKSAKNWKKRNVSEEISKKYPRNFSRNIQDMAPMRKTFDLIGNWLIRHNDNQSGLEEQKDDVQFETFAFVYRL